MKTVLSLKSLFYLPACVLGLWAATSQAQSRATPPALYGQVSVASPTAASLGKFTDIPVSYHTGIPDISVPLYTIKEGALTLPISLSYHAGGIKVLDPASWVGQNWALNAGGVITRSVMGAPDERGTTNTTRGHFSDYGYSSYLTIGGHRANNSTQAAPNDYEFATNIYDGEPDLFFFNFNGYSGKFYFSDDRTPVLVDGQDIKIEYYYPQTGNHGGLGNGNIQGFILTVPTGDRYYFGVTADFDGAVNPVELTYPTSENSSNITGHVFSSYYLHKVVAADGIHTISLDYTREKYSYYTLSTFPVSNLDRTPGAPNLYSKKEFELVSNNLDGVRLAGIHFSTGDIAFTASTIRTDLGAFVPGSLDDYQNGDSQLQQNPARALDRVSITAGSFCKQFNFSYSYYQAFATTLSSFLVTTNTPGINSDKTRLRLDKIVEQSCDGSQAVNPWLFQYNGDYLPRRLSLAQDHWGFYNGAEENNRLNTLIPTYTIKPAFSYTAGTNPGPGTQVEGANRDPAMPYMAAGMLTQVTYPTGGSAVFKFEPNDVWTTYPKWVTSQILSLTAASFTLHAWNYCTFKANSLYKLTVDYNYAKCNNPGSQGGAYLGFGINPQAYVPDTTLVFSSSVYPHNTQTFSTISAGRHRVRLDLNPPACPNDQATASIEEIKLVNVQANAYAGGLRIRTVTMKPSATATDTVVTRYSYRYTNGHSTGALYNRPTYVQSVRNDQLALFGYAGDDGVTHPETGGCLNPNSSPTKTYLISPCGIRPLATTQGSHIGYDVVTVTKADSSRTSYRYADSGVGERTYADVCVRTIDPSICDPTVPSQPSGPANYEYDRGQLKYQSDYNAHWQVVKTTAYHHDYDSTRLVTPAYLAKYIAGAGLNGFYVRRGYWQTKSTVTETIYAPTASGSAPSQVQSQVQYFASKFHHQLTRAVQTASNGDTLETRTQYAFDLRTPNPDALADGNAPYTTACASCDAKYQTRLNSCGNDSCRYNAYTDHLICRAAARQTYIAYRRQNFTDPQSTYQTRHDAAKNNATAGLRALLQLQDDGRLEVVETSHWKNRRLLGATYTTFGPGLSQPATMYPRQQFSLFLPVPSSTFTPATVSGTLVQLDGRYATTAETTLTFDKGALLQVLPKTGIVTSYLWGYNNTLPLAKAIGVRYTTLNTAYSSAGGDLTTLRRAPALAQTLLTTYTHQPLVGLLSQTDPTGRPITYEYDKLGRLIRTRDEQGRILSQQQYHYAQP